MDIKSINSFYNSGRPFPITPGGDKINVTATDSRHYGGKSPIENSPDEVAGTFADMLRKSLEAVNDQQVQADELTQKMVFDPNSVDAHEVMIAAEKARMSLTFAKTVSDGFIKAYRELTNLR